MKFRVMDIKLIPAIKYYVTNLASVHKHFREMLRFNMVLSMWFLFVVLPTNCALELGAKWIFNFVNVLIQEVGTLNGTNYWGHVKLPRISVVQWHVHWQTIFTLKRFSTVMTIIVKLAREMDTFEMIPNIVYVRILFSTKCTAIESLALL